MLITLTAMNTSRSKSVVQMAMLNMAMRPTCVLNDVITRKETAHRPLPGESIPLSIPMGQWIPILMSTELGRPTVIRRKAFLRQAPGLPFESKSRMEQSTRRRELLIKRYRIQQFMTAVVVRYI